MSYRLDLINRSGLFRYYASWYNEFCLINSHKNIAYRISSIIESFEKIKKLEEECLLQFELFKQHSKINKNIQIINFKSISVYEIFVNISYILSSLRIIQNSILNIISDKEKISLPNSMNDFIKKIDKYKLDIEIKNLIKNYWEKNGRHVKDYRDIDEHHNFLIEKVFINTKESKLIVLLPDNPNVKSIKKYRFTHNINAIDFILESFLELEKLLNLISIFYKYEENDFNYNLIIDVNNPNNMEIVYDKLNNTLVCMECFKLNKEEKEEDIKCNNIIIPNLNLNNFSFLKFPKFFKIKKTFYQVYKIKQ